MLLDQQSAASAGSIYGFNNHAGNSDTLVAGAGDKYLSGGGGSDIYVYSSVGGNDIIEDRSLFSKLVFSDIGASDVSLSRSGPSDDLVLTVGSTGKTVTVRGEFNYYDAGVMTSIAFADGTVWTRAQIEQMLLDQQSAAGGGSIYGFNNHAGNSDTLVAGAGDKYLNGGGGSDSYVYSSAGGNDIIDDGGTWSKLVFSDLTPGDILVTHGSNVDDAVLSILPTGATVTVRGGSTQSSGRMQTIEFANGVVWSFGDLLQHLGNSPVVHGTIGADSISAPPDGMTIDADRGDDYIAVSGSGSDTFLFRRGSGHDVLDNPGSGFNRDDTLDLIDILPSEVALTRSGNALLIELPSTGDGFTANWQFWGDGSQIQGLTRLEFSDGTIWNRADIARNAWIRGTSGNDSLNLPSDGVTVAAGRGDDSLSVSGSGSDVIAFATGDGHDVLDNPGSGYNRDDTLALSDVLPSQATLTRSGNALVVDIPSTGDRFTVNYQFWGDGSEKQGLSHLVFSDSTSWDRPAIAAHAWLRGTAGNDSLVLPANGITVAAGAGDDSLSVRDDGSDLIEFAKGDGHDVLDNPGSGYNRHDTLEFTDVLPAEVSLTRLGDALLIDIPDSGDRFTAAWHFWGDGSQIQGLTHLKFSDGTIWDRSQINALAVTGSAGDETIAGTSGSDLFDGHGGNNIIVGGGGSDTYFYRQDYGTLTIDNSAQDRIAGAGELDFGRGLDPQHLWFRQDGDDLIVSPVGATGHVSVDGYFGNDPTARISAFETLGGARLDSQVGQLVAAMASYSASNAGFDPSVALTMPGDPALQDVLTAAWHN